MSATVITVLSYSFQLAGALLLLLWCIGKCDANVVKGCFDNYSNPRWIECDEKGTFTIVSKDNLQESAKNVYLNIVSFANLAFGYALAIFMTETLISRWAILFCVIITVAIILVLEYFCVDRKAKKRYNTDRKIYDNEHTPQKGEIVYKVTGTINDDLNQKEKL